MKKLIFTLMLSMIFFCAFAVNVSAEETSLNAPVVRFKLINHDKIALKWDAVDGADGYIIYRTDVKTGKKYKYKPVGETKVKVENLLPETEYIFTVAPIKKNSDDIIIGEKSSGTRLTTPKEWYCYGEYDVDYKKETSKSRYYRTDYAGTVKEKIDLGDIKAADEIIYCDGWYYVIGDYDAVTAWDEYFWQFRAGAERRKCVARVKEDSSIKEILFDDFAESEGFNYRTVTTSDYIYIYRQYYDYNFDDKESLEYKNDLIIAPYDISDFYKISLKTGEVTKVCDIFTADKLTFDVHDDYIYYTYKELGYDPEEDIYFYGPYEYNDGKYNDLHGEYRKYLCRVKNDGTEKTKIISYKSDEIYFNDIYYNNSNLILYDFYGGKKIYIMDLDSKKVKKLCEVPEYIGKFEVVNDYIYCGLYKESDYSMKKTLHYCRIRISDGDMVIQDKPFEWYY